MDHINLEVVTVGQELVPFQVKQVCDYIDRLEYLIRKIASISEKNQYFKPG